MPSGELIRKIQLPATPVTDFGLFAEDDGGMSPTPNAFRLFEHGNAFEQEPNNEIAQGTPVELPLAINGIIETDGDVDCFKFAAKKGQVFEVECFARRIRSGLDPVMNIYFADGRALPATMIHGARTATFDSRFRRTASMSFASTIIWAAADRTWFTESSFRASHQPDAGHSSQRTLWTIPPTDFCSQGQSLRNPDHREPSELWRRHWYCWAKTCLPGITMHCDPMPANQNTMPVVFEATADARTQWRLGRFLAKHADPNQNISGGFRNRADYLIAEPNQSLYRWKDVDRLAVAVVDEIPFRMEIVKPKSAAGSRWIDESEDCCAQERGLGRRRSTCNFPTGRRESAQVRA